MANCLRSVEEINTALQFESTQDGESPLQDLSNFNVFADKNQDNICGRMESGMYIAYGFIGASLVVLVLAILIRACYEEKKEKEADKKHLNKQPAAMPSYGQDAAIQ
jgi:hypothetical protein